jgi:hypothetical protein
MVPKIHYICQLAEKPGRASITEMLDCLGKPAAGVGKIDGNASAAIHDEGAPGLRQI